MARGSIDRQFNALKDEINDGKNMGSNYVVINPDLVPAVDDKPTVDDLDQIPPKEDDPDKVPDNPTDKDIFIPVNINVQYPEEFETLNEKFKRDKLCIWDFRHRKYAFYYPEYDYQEGDSFTYMGKEIKIRKFINMLDEHNVPIAYVIFEENGIIRIQEEIFFEYKYKEAIVDKFVKTPTIEFTNKRIELEFTEGKIYPLEFKTDGVITTIISSNTAGTMEHTNEAVKPAHQSIEFYMYNGKLYFKPLKAGLNVVTIQIADYTYSKVNQDTIIIKVNDKSKLESIN